MESSDIYQAPETDIITTDTEKGETVLYVVSLKKLTVLFIVTLGIYAVYWNYRNWKLLRQHRGVKCLPVMRAIFSIFFFASLLKHINAELGVEKNTKHLDVTPLASAYIVLNVVSGICDRLSSRTDTVGILDFVSLILLPFICGVLTTVQQAANLSQGDANGESNSHMTALNWIWLLIGGALWALILLGFAAMLAPASIPF